MKPRLPKASTAFVTASASFKIAAAIFSLAISAAVSGQQAITGIITDFNTYWKTSSSSINPVKPNNSHNLLAFTYNGVQYSTGANNALLSSHGETFVDGDFWSLPIADYPGTVNSNTKVGLGEMYDGVHNGKSPTPYPNTFAMYLTDGIKGLDIGTCVANLPAGNITFFVNNIRPDNIGDGIPDILVTQVADPSSSTDKYSFINANGNTVGQVKTVTFNSIPAIANWTADFYEASTNPMTLTSGFTNTDRPIRLWAADLSDFGITQANYTSITSFKINLSGSSDVAFVAYNNKTMTIGNGTVLPVKLIDFTASNANGKGFLNWSTANEKDADYFVVEKSSDGTAFKAIDTITAAGESTSTKSYSVEDAQLQPGVSYYRLKIVSTNAGSSYSKTIQLVVKEETRIHLFPNPANTNITLSYPTGKIKQISIYNPGGVLMHQRKAINNHQISIDLSSYTKGIYYIVITDDHKKHTRSFIVK